MMRKPATRSDNDALHSGHRRKKMSAYEIRFLPFRKIISSFKVTSPKMEYLDSMCKTDNPQIYVIESNKNETTSVVDSGNVDARGLAEPVSYRAMTSNTSILSCVGHLAESVNSTQVNNDLFNTPCGKFDFPHAWQKACAQNRTSHTSY